MIGFGLIGCGRIADKHIASLAACSSAELVAVCDIRAERMQAAEQAYRARSGSNVQIAAYDDVNLLLADKRVQAVVISTHSALHAELAIQALQAGKHVMVEKPLALDIEEVRSFAEMAEAQGLCVQVCHQLRYRPLLSRIKQLIDQGSLGKLYLGTATIRLQRSRQYYEEARWRGTWDQDGGMLLNQGIHLVDLLQWFLGDAARIYGRMARTDLPKQTEDVAAGLIQFTGGAIGVIEANTISLPNNFDNAITLFGDRGTISIGGIKLDEIRRWHTADGSEPPDLATLKADEHLLMYEAFVRSLQGEEDAMRVDVREGSKALEIIMALYESVRTKQEIELPLRAFHTNIMSETEGWS
jgi:predicted dehydrogenase